MNQGLGGLPAGYRPERELSLSDSEFQRISRMIYQRAGIVLADHKRQMVYGRLARRVRLYGFSGFGDYIDLLDRDPRSDEWVAFTNALTTNLTSFFREAHHFDLLANFLFQRRGVVRIWCCAASTGEEPYSIAMVLREVYGEHPNARVLATDIDTGALATAAEGIYPAGHLARVNEERVRRFFLRGRGSREGTVRVRPEVAAMVDFQSLNLVDQHWGINGPFDAIFCRNVMIYFDQQTQAKILARFAPLLRPDGLLFAGHSENFSYISTDFKLLGQTVYTRA